ncbi:MAG TPA: cupin domain-containing protein [Blastocatellia bacterium]|nr:cupin domain-containing protein [Blastocatellia bacterium]
MAGKISKGAAQNSSELPTRSFSELIAPIGVEQFFSDFWEKNFLHVRRESPCYYDQILNVGDLDQYLQDQNLPPNFIRVVNNQIEYEPREWTKLERLRTGDTCRVVAVDKLFSIFGAGGTIILNRAHKYIPSLTRFAVRLERELKFPVTTNLYLTPPHSRGLLAHFDPHCVMILQISGCKKWRLYHFAETLPAGEVDYLTRHETAGSPAHEYLLEPGDLLYVPRGLVHEADTLDQTSIHITLGLKTESWFHLIEDLAALAKSDPVFRQGLPTGLSGERELEDFLRTFAQHFQALWEKTGASALLERRRRSLVGNRLVDQQARLSDWLQSERLNLDSIVVRRPGIDFIVERSHRRTVIEFGIQKLIIERPFVTSLDRFLKDRPFAVREIEGLLTEKGKVELASRFVRAGWLTILS